MFIDFMIDIFRQNREKDAIVWNDDVFSYQWLLDRVRYWREVVKSEDVKGGAVTVLEADFSPDSVALFLALVESGCVLVPLTNAVGTKKPKFIEIAQGEVSLTVDGTDNVRIARLPNSANHEFYDALRRFSHPGLVLFSSGSTGKSKAAVHDMVAILEKFRVPRRSLRTITFLLYDHIGGLNTLLYTLSNGGCIVTVRDRTPDTVLSAIEKYKVELLPTSPTFINLVLLSEAYRRYNLTSLRTVTYGTEPMPESTLRRFHNLFPDIELQQTYGLSEVGILRSKSKSSDSLWVKVGGEGFETRVVDRILQIKAQSAMLGYLNAPSPFTEDGWFNTGDSVEVDGEYIRILGRTSEIINVGGEKVYPAEIEGVIQSAENVGEVTVYGEKNPIVGNIVCAKVSLLSDEDPKEFTQRLKKYCRERLNSYKVPIKVTVVNEKQHSDRFKKIRPLSYG
jgi:acyl-CoA synthetase (AMP-forming)/AMP-acid ligase II